MIVFCARRLEPEIMDRDDLDPRRHHQALRGLGRLNRLSGSTRVVWNAMRDLLRPPREGPLRIVDVATGGADVPIGLWRAARRRGAAVALSACDRSPTALAYAAARVRAAGATVELFRHDLDEPLEPYEYDVVVCSLFLHHLRDDQAVTLLRSLASAARRRLIVNDLHRGHAHRMLVGLATRLVTRSEVVHIDAMRSMRAAFTPREVRALAVSAGLSGAVVRPCRPCRLLLQWDVP